MLFSRVSGMFLVLEKVFRGMLNLTEQEQSNILAPISQDRNIQKRHCIVTMAQAKDPETLEDFHAEVSRYDEDESVPELQAEDDYDYDYDAMNMTMT